MKLFSTKSLKIARESLTIDKDSSPTPEGQHEWRKFVGSIRRKVQKHASPSASTDQSPVLGQATKDSLSRKNSLTLANKFDLFKRDKSTEETVNKKGDNNRKPLTKQKSIGSSTDHNTNASSSSTAAKSDLFKTLTFKDKSKSVSVKHVDSLTAPKLGDSFFNKGVRKSSDKMKDSGGDKAIKTGFNFSRCKSAVASNKHKEEKRIKQDDFLKATMRIFLVVSPPVGKLQVIILHRLFVLSRLQ